MASTARDRRPRRIWREPARACRRLRQIILMKKHPQLCCEGARVRRMLPSLREISPRKKIRCKSPCEAPYRPSRRCRLFYDCRRGGQPRKTKLRGTALGTSAHRPARRQKAARSDFHASRWEAAGCRARLRRAVQQHAPRRTPPDRRAKLHDTVRQGLLATPKIRAEVRNTRRSLAARALPPPGALAFVCGRHGDVVEIVRKPLAGGGDRGLMGPLAAQAQGRCVSRTHPPAQFGGRRRHHPTTRTPTDVRRARARTSSRLRFTLGPQRCKRAGKTSNSQPPGALNDCFKAGAGRKTISGANDRNRFEIRSLLLFFLQLAKPEMAVSIHVHRAALARGAGGRTPRRG